MLVGVWRWSLWLFTRCFRLIPSECVQGQKGRDRMGFILQESVLFKAAWQQNRCPPNIVKWFRCFVTETPWTNWIWGSEFGFPVLDVCQFRLLDTFVSHPFLRFFICDACRTFDQLGEITPETRCTRSKSNRSVKTQNHSQFWQKPLPRSRDLEDLQNSTPRIAASRILKMNHVIRQNGKTQQSNIVDEEMLNTTGVALISAWIE